MVVVSNKRKWWELIPHTERKNNETFHGKKLINKVKKEHISFRPQMHKTTRGTWKTCVSVFSPSFLCAGWFNTTSSHVNSVVISASTKMGESLCRYHGCCNSRCLARLIRNERRHLVNTNFQHACSESVKMIIHLIFLMHSYIFISQMTFADKWGWMCRCSMCVAVSRRSLKIVFMTRCCLCCRLQRPDDNNSVPRVISLPGEHILNQKSPAVLLSGRFFPH